MPLSAAERRATRGDENGKNGETTTGREEEKAHAEAEQERGREMPMVLREVRQSRAAEPAAADSRALPTMWQQ